MPTSIATKASGTRSGERTSTAATSRPRSYTYVDEGDKALKSFSVEHDRQFRIPFIKQALATAGGQLTLFASPWSPPAFMKTNGDMLHGGKLKPEFRQAWANYYTKFIKAYEREGIPIWGITVQNEPMATQTWESCIYTAEDERDFLKNFLGPTMTREGLGDRKIIAWDHNRDLIYQRVSTILADPEAAQYVWGIGFHWYEPWSGGTMMFDNVRLVRETFPEQEAALHRGHRRFVQGRRHPQLAAGRVLRPVDDQRLQRRRRRLDGLERVARRTGWTEPCRELLLRPRSRRHEDR